MPVTLHGNTTTIPAGLQHCRAHPPLPALGRAPSRVLSTRCCRQPSQCSRGWLGVGSGGMQQRLGSMAYAASASFGRSAGCSRLLSELLDTTGGCACMCIWEHCAVQSMEVGTLCMTAGAPQTCRMCWCFVRLASLGPLQHIGLLGMCCCGCPWWAHYTAGMDACYCTHHLGAAGSALHPHACADHRLNPQLHAGTRRCLVKATAARACTCSHPSCLLHLLCLHNGRIPAASGFGSVLFTD